MDPEKMSVDVLWRKLSHVTKDDGECYKVQKIILRKLASPEGESPGLISPSTVKIFLDLVAGNHRTEVKVLQVCILRRLCANRGLRDMLIQQGLISALVDGLTCSHLTPTDPLKCQLLKDTVYLLYRLASCADQEQLKSIGESGVVMALAELCNPVTSLFYTYTEEGRQILHSHTWDQDRVAGCVPMSTLSLKACYRDYLGQAFHTFLLPSKGYVVELYDTNDPDNEINIQELMMSSGSVWPEIDVIEEKSAEENSAITSSCEEQGSENVSLDWTDARVTYVVDAQHFWAHLGTKAIETIAIVQKILTEFPEDERVYLKSPPKVRSFIGVNHESQPLGHIRGQVVELVGDTKAKIFSLDYGFTAILPWNTLYLLTQNMNLKDYKPQAFLCKLKGCSPPPSEPRLIEDLLCVLLSLSTNASLLHNYFNKKTLFKTLACLVGCPHEGIKTKTARLIGNMARTQYPQLKLGMTGHKILSALIGECMKIRVSSGDHTADVACLDAVRNLLYRNSDICNMFGSQLNGLSLMVKLCDHKDEKVREATHRVLRNYTGNANLTAAFDKLQEPIPSSMLDTGRGRDSTTTRGRSMSRSRSQSRGRSQSQGRSQASNGDSRLPVVASRTDLVDDVDSADEESEDNLVSAAAGGDARLLFQNQLCYEWYGKLQLRNGENTQLMGVIKTTNDIDQNKGVILPHICAFLNCNGGTVYFGVQDNGTVTGVEISRGQRDRFRIFMDQCVLQKLYPKVQPTQFEFTFVPLITRHPINNQVILTANMYVIELSFKATFEELYMIQKQCYMRFGRTTRLVSAQELHQLIVSNNEIQYINEVTALQTEINNCKLGL